MNPDSIFFLALFGLPLLLWLILSVRQLLRAYESRRWPTTAARVIRVSPASVATYRVPLRQARAEFSYEVAGKSYTSSSVGGGKDTTLPSLWPAPPDLAPGTQHAAYYDPLNPSAAGLVPGPGFHDWLALLTPTVALVLIAYSVGFF